MSGEKQRVDAYMATIARLEPDITMIDPGAFYASAAISLKRIADELKRKNDLAEERIVTLRGINTQYGKFAYPPDVPKSAPLPPGWDEGK